MLLMTPWSGLAVATESWRVPDTAGRVHCWQKSASYMHNLLRVPGPTQPPTLNGGRGNEHWLTVRGEDLVRLTGAVECLLVPRDG